MSFYFPYNISGAASASIISGSIVETATTASISSLGVATATKTFYAATVGTIGPSGSRGTDATGCSGTVQGPTGSQGPSGSRGQANYDCPAGYVACPSLNPPSALYSIVCLPLPVPCNGSTIICPSTYTP